MKTITLAEILASNEQHCINPLTGISESGNQTDKKTLLDGWSGTIIEAFSLLDDWEPERLIGVISWNDWLSNDDFIIICEAIKQELDSSYMERVELLIGYIENNYSVKQSVLLILQMAKSTIGKAKTLDIILSCFPKY